MVYYSISFFAFFLIVILGYYIIPVNVRYIWLLIVSYVFYAQFDVRCVIYLLAITILSYICGRVLDYVRNLPNAALLRKMILICGIGFTIGTLIIVKYSNLIIGYTSKILTLCKNESQFRELDILIPVGLSFYTLQALGYLYDV